MAYDYVSLAEQIVALLDSDPSKTLVAIAAVLKVDRHTVARALAANGHSFRSLRRRVIYERAVRTIQASPHLSFKEIAVRLGFSSGSALTRFIRQCSGRPPREVRRTSIDADERPDAPLTDRH